MPSGNTVPVLGVLKVVPYRYSVLPSVGGRRVPTDYLSTVWARDVSLHLFFIWYANVSPRGNTSLTHWYCRRTVLKSTYSYDIKKSSTVIWEILSRGYTSDKCEHLALYFFGYRQISIKNSYIKFSRTRKRKLRHDAKLWLYTKSPYSYKKGIPEINNHGTGPSEMVDISLTDFSTEACCCNEFGSTELIFVYTGSYVELCVAFVSCDRQVFEIKSCEGISHLTVVRCELWHLSFNS